MKNKKFIFIGLILLILANFLAFKEVFSLAGPRYLKIIFFDVGQGDAIFIQTPDRHHIIIDGGPGTAVKSKLKQNLPIWQRQIDAIILTHPDADHLTGLIGVLKKYKSDYIIWTGVRKKGLFYDKWLSVVKEKEKQGTKIIIAKAGQKLSTGSVLMDILNPQENLFNQDFSSKINDSSIVTKLKHGENAFLFTGDISGTMEKKIIKQFPDLSADILKVSHHGSKYSTTEEFLTAVLPSFAIISAGAGNPYGHPSSEVLQRLKNNGISYYRSDVNGDITIISNGFSYAISVQH